MFYLKFFKKIFQISGHFHKKSLTELRPKKAFLFNYVVYSNFDHFGLQISGTWWLIQQWRALFTQSGEIPPRARMTGNFYAKIGTWKLRRAHSKCARFHQFWRKIIDFWTFFSDFQQIFADFGIFMPIFVLGILNLRLLAQVWPSSGYWTKLVVAASA